MGNKKYTVYRIENLKNSKSYIGCHITNDINDSYMGSGKLIKLAINKYGIDNFKKQILFVFNNEIDMFEKEKALIKQLNPEYNLHEGGNGGFTYINNNNLGMQNEHAKLGGQKMAINMRLDPNKLHKRKKEGSDLFKRLHQDGIISGGNKKSDGWKHSQETKDKISKSNSGKPSWNKGIPMSAETKNKISSKLKKNTDKFCLECNKKLKYCSTTNYCNSHKQSKLAKYKEQILNDRKNMSLRQLAKKYNTSYESIRRLIK